jgi:ASC-1-like (ASCH) protein
MEQQKDVKDIKLRIIKAGHRAVEELIRVAEESIIKNGESLDGDLAADKLKNAAATKKLAIFDAFEILTRIESEKESIEMSGRGVKQIDTKQGFAERRSK